MPIEDFTHFRCQSPKTDSQPLSMASTNSETNSQEEKTDVIEIIGGYGPWQRNLFVLLFLASIPSSWHNLMMTFMAPPGVDFWCARPPEIGTQIKVQTWRNLTATAKGLDSCQMVPYWRNDSYSRLPIKCHHWEYNTTFYSSTIIHEWDLVCDREWLISLSKSIYNVGFLLAMLIFGQLSDSLGRRPTILVSYVINVCAGILSAFSTSFAVFAALRFFTAIGAAGFYTISFVLMVELVSPRLRPVIGIGINFGWCLAFISLPAVAWIIRDWVWLQLAVTVPKILFFPIFWMIPESPRWLLIKRKKEQFRQTVTKAAIANGRKEEWIHMEIDRLLASKEKFLVGRGEEEEEEESKKATILDLFRTPGLWIHALNLFYNWLVNSFIYFGLSYNTEDLAGDVYLNFFASGAVEFPAYLCTIYVLRRMGRRIPLSFGMCAGGVACALSIVIPDYVGSFWLKVALSLLGKFFITATFATVYVVTAEIVPTVVRNIGVGTGSTFARIGSIVAPFVRELDSATSSSVSNAIFAALSVSSGIFVLFLPETSDIATTDTLEEATEISRCSNHRSNEKTCTT